MAVSDHLTTSFIFGNWDFAQTTDIKLIPQYFNFYEVNFYHLEEILNNCIPFLIYIYSNIYRQHIYRSVWKTYLLLTL